ncbi:hypothetical protein MCAMS1_00221 [biofilm metagenome]
MNIPKDINQLTELFEKFGAREPGAWASSQVNEGIPQLQRYLFLRQAWKKIYTEDDVSWIDREIELNERFPGSPYSGLAEALKQSLSKGVTRQELTDIARNVQAQFLYDLCYLLSHPGFTEPELSDFNWGLFQLDDNDNPIQPRIDYLYESVLDTDPTGREMRPRETSKE